MDFEDDCTALYLKEYTWAQVVAHLNNLNIDQPYWQYMQGMYVPRQHQTGAVHACAPSSLVPQLPTLSSTGHERNPTWLRLTNGLS